MLRGIDFTIPPGRIYGLVGHNGAGKTTTLNALLGLIDCGGQIEVLGLDPFRNRARLMNDVAFVSDVASLPRFLQGAGAVRPDRRTSIRAFRGRKPMYFYRVQTYGPNFVSKPSRRAWSLSFTWLSSWRLTLSFSSSTNRRSASISPTESDSIEGSWRTL